MLLNIRESIPSKDYDRLAEILSAHRAIPAHIEDIVALNTPNIEGDLRELVCGETVEGQIIGLAALAHQAQWTPEHFYLGVVVDPAYTRRGAGSALFDYIYDRIVRQGGRDLRCRVRDDDPTSLHFATQRGFSIDYQTFQAVLDVTTFDETPYRPVLARVVQHGLRFTTLAAEGCTSAALHKLYHVTRATDLDRPDSDGSFITFEEFEEAACDTLFNEGAGQIVVEDEATGAYVGVAAVSYHAGDHTLHHRLTGVMPEFRGQGIATALKVQAIRYAQAKGVTALYTQNHTDNAPMLAINQKLGYRRLAGYCQMRALIPSPQ